MRNPRKLYELWRLADTYSTRPSELLGISCDIQAFYLDRACWLFGTRLDGDIQTATKNAKNDVAKRTAAHHVMQKAMSSGNQAGDTKSPSGYSDPALTKG